MSHSRPATRASRVMRCVAMATGLKANAFPSRRKHFAACGLQIFDKRLGFWHTPRPNERINQRNMTYGAKGWAPIFWSKRAPELFSLTFGSHFSFIRRLTSRLEILFESHIKSFSRKFRFPDRMKGSPPPRSCRISALFPWFFECFRLVDWWRHPAERFVNSITFLFSFLPLFVRAPQRLQLHAICATNVDSFAEWMGKSMNICSQIKCQPISFDIFLWNFMKRHEMFF